jgi:hypothetical protein
VIHKDFTIRNFRWGTYLFPDDTLNHLATSSSNKSKDTLFTLMETHDGEMIIYTNADPDYAVAIRRHIRDHVTDYRPTQVNVKGALGGTGFDPSAPGVAMTFTEPPGGYHDERRPKIYGFNGSYPIMLQSFNHPRYYIYAPDMTITDAVEGHYDDPGDGGLWIFDPPLPEDWLTTERGGKLEKYRGQRCAWDCHGPSKASNYVIWIVGIGAGVLVTCCLCFVCVMVLGKSNEQ